jgi:hypothetical protein
MPNQTPVCVAPVTYPAFSPLHTHHDTTPTLPASDGMMPTVSPVPAPSADPNISIIDDAIQEPHGHNPASNLRRSQCKRKAPDFLRPKFKGKAYAILNNTHLPRKQRVPTTWAYPEKQRVSQPEIKRQRLLKMKDTSIDTKPFQGIFWRYREQQRSRRMARAGWWTHYNPHAHQTTTGISLTANDAFYERSMPPSTLPDIFPNGPLNLNDDGTSITLKKSHLGPNAAHWL